MKLAIDKNQKKSFGSRGQKSAELKDLVEVSDLQIRYRFDQDVSILSPKTTTGLFQIIAQKSMLVPNYIGQLQNWKGSSMRARVNLFCLRFLT